MKRTFVMISLAAAALFSGRAFAGETPRSTVQLLINASKSGDVKGVKAQLLNGHQLGKGDAAGILAMQLMFQKAYITSVENAGYGKAIVYISIKDPLSGERSTCPVSVKKVNGEWLVSK